CRNGMPKSPSSAAATATAMNVSGSGERNRRCNPRNRPIATARMIPGCTPNSIYFQLCLASAPQRGLPVAARDVKLWAEDPRRRAGRLIGLAALFADVDPGLAISIVRRNRHIGVRRGALSRRVGLSRLDAALCPRRLLALGRPRGVTGALRGLGDAIAAAQL